MSGLSDRLRRVLSDRGGAAAAPRPPLDGARGGPSTGLGAGAAPPGPRSPPLDVARGGPVPAHPGNGDIRARLEALGVGLARDLPPAPPHPPEEAGDARPLEDRVGGHVRSTPSGSFLQTERRRALGSAHGRVILGDALSHPIPLRQRERGPDGRDHVDLRDAAFLDTETTGLSGGTGTVAFLVGVGRVVGDEFVVRQYCMRDYPEEAALLHGLMEDVGDSPLVTFNGRCFDWPLLTTRLRLHRLKLRPRAHLDLLPPARRLWAGSAPSHSLTSLERHVLGLEREDDLPGWRIPEAYFHYLRTGESGTVARAFRHNEIDVVSMLALVARVGAILRDPAATLAPSPKDHLGTARLLADLRDLEGARRCLEAGLSHAAPKSAAERALLRPLGHLLRRLGEAKAAVEPWTRVARHSPEFEPRAYEEIAKLYEYRLRDPRAALRWTEEALGRAVTGTAVNRSFERRAARLRGKLAAKRS